ncbi:MULTISPECIES: hypothetical protein [unclassified Microbacterium]|uniref:hypothetical protein n=1 Tax=unclassified Microbacterium TaxID=2609290 RepID=UPI0038F80812
MRRLASVVAMLGVLLLWGFVGAVSFFAFVSTSGVGLAASVGQLSIGQNPVPWAGAALLLTGLSALVLYLALYWRARSSLRVAWVVAAVLGALLAPVVGAYAFIQALLLTSATRGPLTESSYEKDLLVEAALPSWTWWLLLLIVGFIATSVFLGRGPRIAATANDSAPRRFAWYVYAALSTVPLSCVGALVTTLLFSAAPG